MSFVDQKSQEKWKSCCKAASDCCQQMLGLTKSSDAVEVNEILDVIDKKKYTAASQSNLTASSVPSLCPPTWDGWTCWPQTRSNQVALAECPHFIYFETEPPVCARK